MLSYGLAIWLSTGYAQDSPTRRPEMKENELKCNRCRAVLRMHLGWLPHGEPAWGGDRPNATLTCLDCGRLDALDDPQDEYVRRENEDVNRSRIHGHCKALDQIEYEYEATWHRFPEWLTWNASVYSAEQPPWHPAGMMSGAGAAADESMVRIAINIAIQAHVSA